MSQARYMVASGTALPFSNNSFDRIQIGNVFGASISANNRNSLLAEFQRVLRSAGSLIIAETLSPLPITDLEPLLEQ